MEKPYDLKDLGMKLKDKGLVVAEDVAMEVYATLKEWLKESATMSENKYDDLIGAILPIIDGVVVPQIEKIDGK